MTGRMAQRRLLEKLQLLCECGAGLEAIAAPASALARDILDAASGSIFWFADDGSPGGYYHDTPNAEIKELFVSRFDELFTDPGELNIISLSRHDGPAIGRMVGADKQAAYHRSNVYKFLAGPLGHEYCLDVRIDDGDKTAALLVLWNGAGKPFTRADWETAATIRALMQQAIAKRHSQIDWQSRSSRTSQMVVDAGGDHLISIDTECESILTSAHLLGQRIPFASEMRAAPAFAKALAGKLMAGEVAAANLPTVDGRLVCTAAYGQIRQPGQEGARQIFIAVDRQTPAEVDAIHFVCALPLTLLQKQIALYGMRGGNRADCAAALGTSNEALKKHLRAVLEHCQLREFSELRDLFRRLPAQA